MTTIRAFLPKIRAFFPIFEKGQSRPSSSPSPPPPVWISGGSVSEETIVLAGNTKFRRNRLYNGGIAALKSNFAQITHFFFKNKEDPQQRSFPSAMIAILSPK